MKMAIIKTASGGVAVIIPNARKFGDAETDAAWFENERSKLFGDDGSQVVEEGDEVSIKGKLPWVSDPDMRRFRRDAHQWNDSSKQVEDDPKLSTDQEIEEAIDTMQEEAILKEDVDRTLTEKKLVAGRADLLDEDELDDCVVKWRRGGKAPSVSSFEPPPDRIKPQKRLKRARNR